MEFADRLALPEILVGRRTRGFLWPGPPVPGERFASGRHSLFDGSFTWPVMVAKRTALDHNVGTLAAFAERHGLALAPHGKTTMAPALFQAQLDAGAWGISAASAAQVLVHRSAGVPRVLLANEILDAAALRWLAGEIEHFEFLCFVDSLEGVRALSEAAGAVPFRVLAELGHVGGRTGCRGLAELMEVAAAARDAEGVELAGVACYEGTREGAEEVRAFLRDLRDAAEAVAPHVPGRLVVSAGGSAWFDLVAEELGPLTGELGALVILRSGAYIAHDDGFYRERTPWNRLPGEGLRPALEVWAQVLSVPEPGLALVGMGKRDVPYDIDLPTVRAVRRGPAEAAVPLGGVTVTRVQDQHAYLTGEGLRPGDLVSFGISHPCTAFDKWRVIPVVDDDYVVVDLIDTCF